MPDPVQHHAGVAGILRAELLNELPPLEREVNGTQDVTLFNLVKRVNCLQKVRRTWFDGFGSDWSLIPFSGLTCREGATHLHDLSGLLNSRAN